MLTTPSHSDLTDTDHRFLDAAIRLGKSRLGRTSPNPSVGAIVVSMTDDGPVVVGRGVTGDGGRPHGETVALAQAGEKARGATCYVSLEPCAHHGKTPPCVDALAAAGVVHVVIAQKDPDPRVSGKGVEQLFLSGIHVSESGADADSMAAHAGHICRATRGRPHIMVKLAISADGMIGRKGEGNTPITGEHSRALVHAMRARADAILVGVGTILADNPDLTCRLPGMESWSPTRIVLDSQARTPLDAKLFDNLETAPVLIFTGMEADEERVICLEEKGAEVLRIGHNGSGLSLDEAINSLAERGVTRLMVEGGAQVIQSFLAANKVDEVALFSSPCVIGQDGVSGLPDTTDLVGALENFNLEAGSRVETGDDHLTVFRRVEA